MSKFNFDSKIIEWEMNKKELMEKLAINAKDFFVKQFDSESWEGNQWQETVDGHHPILVKTGQLRSDLENCIKEVDSEGYTLSVDTPYAKYHNSGTEHIPQRQFIGEDPELDKEQDEIIKQHINKLFKK